MTTADDGESRRPLIHVQQPTAPPTASDGTVGCRMLRSPSKESVTTDLSLFSVSSQASMAALRVTFKSYADPNSGSPNSSPTPVTVVARGPSPNPDSRRNRLSVPGHQLNCPWASPGQGYGVTGLWFEEETELIRSCGALSTALGIQKSFSTSDITNLLTSSAALKSSVSEMAVWDSRVELAVTHPRLDHASRSCSLWVAVGDMASTSQLPSPQGKAPTSHGTSLSVDSYTPAFTPADLIRSVNKKVRQNYIRRRLMTTYRALERLSQSEFNLDRLELPASLIARGLIQKDLNLQEKKTTSSDTVPDGVDKNVGNTTALISSELAKAAADLAGTASTGGGSLRGTSGGKTAGGLPLTLRDVERERGKPLSKYERNMMIFNWLHSLDDSAFEGLP